MSVSVVVVITAVRDHARKSEVLYAKFAAEDSINKPFGASVAGSWS